VPGLGLPYIILYIAVLLLLRATPPCTCPPTQVIAADAIRHLIHLDPYISAAWLRHRTDFTLTDFQVSAQTANAFVVANADLRKRRKVSSILNYYCRAS